MIEVKFLTRFIDITGERSIQIEDVANINELLEYLYQRYDATIKDVLFDNNGDLRDYLKVMLNGEDIRNIDGLNTTLKNGDQVAMFQTIAGG
jgi:molybdopterin synthase sulfur carrier subunit